MKKVFRRLLFIIVLAFVLVGCDKKEKKFENNTIIAESIFGDVSISLTCECEIIPSKEYAVFFRSNCTLEEMKKMITEATIYDDSQNTQVTFLKDGYYFVLKEKFSSNEKNKYVLGCDYTQVIVETGVEHYTIPFPQFISPVYNVGTDTISLEYKDYIIEYYKNVRGFTIESTNEQIVIKQVKNTIDNNSYADIFINFGDTITITLVGE